MQQTFPGRSPSYFCRDTYTHTLRSTHPATPSMLFFLRMTVKAMYISSLGNLGAFKGFDTQTFKLNCGEFSYLFPLPSCILFRQLKPESSVGKGCCGGLDWLRVYDMPTWLEIPVSLGWFKTHFDLPVSLASAVDKGRTSFICLPTIRPTDYITASWLAGWLTD